MIPPIALILVSAAARIIVVGSIMKSFRTRDKRELERQIRMKNYLLEMLDRNGVEVTDFDLIAMNTMSES